ncbi:ABC transporter ATP-binding protein [Picrophilus oshimae]|uniref:Glycerol-3-P ABC transporter ATP binding protein n=1 Tax=Picrophilus torridus (strain ATCC 700027 / DSM 9790 / JCM 10055 / NBRC 100828 / KAW 2/3) TaxID=1122961 RepID=Q6L2X9_PICTO|nr:ABC transporter ATP-binding protein [Picrophilus oshimae]AAT42672.1 glycerol-3-P ABC transporter ATP binding protein [Picrophilus oshimae DSM 9789]
MVSVSLKNIKKYYNQTLVLKDVNLDIMDGEFFILLGSSGSGKSTTLNIISGVDRQTSGDIFFDTQNVNNMGPVERNIAMVFQDYALYPHMTVYKNLAFPLKMRKVDRDSIEKKVNEVAEKLGLASLLNRYPKELSGGQAQRVALGRALVRDPSLFLLDEPLSNLDAKIRGQIRTELKLIQEDLKKTFIYVTHDQQEAMSLGDHIAILHNGRIEQFGKPLEIYKKPKTRYVAAFLGDPEMNFFDLKKNDGVFSNDDIDGVHIDYNGDEITLGIRPEDIMLKKQKDSNIGIKVIVRSVELFGSYAVIIADTLSGKELRIRTDNNVNVSREINVYIDRSSMLIFDKNGDVIDYENTKVIE